MANDYVSNFLLFILFSSTLFIHVLQSFLNLPDKKYFFVFFTKYFQIFVYNGFSTSFRISQIFGYLLFLRKEPGSGDDSRTSILRLYYFYFGFYLFLFPLFSERYRFCHTLA